ncbi:MAG: toll/interleukin-1 receptor domain-containing protein [Coriobacteriales bacterium]|jgi:hypothetical protein|nr:toll/interleukin-1 receptor domain-containing protein [Coriobacteriales bacterium]
MRKTTQQTDNSGIFISHLGGDAAFDLLRSQLEQRGIGYIGDSQIEAGSDFHARLRQMLAAATGGIVLLADGIFASPWVLYEIGLLEAAGKQILFYYDNAAADAPARQAAAAGIPDFLRRYQVINDREAACGFAARASVFDGLFAYPTLELSRDDFGQALGDRLQSAHLEIGLPGLCDQVDVELLRFGCIVVRLAAAGRVLDVDEDLCELRCEPRLGSKCAMNAALDIDCAALREVFCRDELETIALNSILHEVSIEGDELRYHLPLHSHFGLTFKCFVDVLDASLKSETEELLRGAGMLDVSYSESGEGRRIYFLLPTQIECGLFHIQSPEGILNNFLCPGTGL